MAPLEQQVQHSILRVCELLALLEQHAIISLLIVSVKHLAPYHLAPYAAPLPYRASTLASSISPLSERLVAGG